MNGEKPNPASESNAPAPAVSKKLLWTGRIITALPALFLLFDGVMKLVKPPAVVQETVQLGYSESVILPLGIVPLACRYRRQRFV